MRQELSALTKKSRKTLGVRSFYTMAKRKEWLQKSIIFAGSEKCKHEITFVKFWACIVLVTEVRNNMLYVLFLLNVDMLPYKIKSCYIRNPLRDEQNDSFATDSDTVT
jgi:hypothetical protein